VTEYDDIHNDDETTRARSRRDFIQLGLKGAVAASAALAAGGQVVNAAEALALPPGGGRTRSSGLVEAGPELALPRGFRYKTFGRFGSVMSDGFMTPPIHDGMGVFPDGDNYRLVRNHETGDSNDNVGGTVLGDPATAYDPTAPGGTTTLIVDRKGNLLSSFLSLNGSDSNCGGAPTPWGTWLTCEETVVGTTSGGGWSRPHGYVFEVDAYANGPRLTAPITGMGRFLHECAAVDPDTAVVYMTSDEGPDGFYRFIPTNGHNYLGGGTLQALKITGQPNYDTTASHTAGVVLPCEWVTIPDPDPAGADDDGLAVYNQAAVQGAAVFEYGEGATMLGISCVFNNNEGGAEELGQVWKYTPTSNRGRLDETGELELLFESPSIEILDTPDNMCTSPSGAIVMAEDGSEDRQFVRALLPGTTTVIPIAENLVDVRLQLIDASGKLYDPNVPDDDYGPTDGLGRSEFAGPRFSPDGKWLFVNIQVPGITCAITGPWHSLGL